VESERVQEWIAGEIRRFVKQDPGNRLDHLDGSPIFDEPLVGFAAGDDAIFQQLKQVIGEFHLTPSEVMKAVAGERGRGADDGRDLGVISYVLPVAKRTRRENARMKEQPSRRWAHTRLFGEHFNRKLQTHLVSFLEKEGRFVIAPESEESLFRVLRDERVGWASAWSQRHVAFAAGLGSFGLSDGLITPAGVAHRVGSLIVDLRFESPPRPEDIHRDCLSYRGHGCRDCGKRCPVDAISESGHDKQRCSEFVFGQIPLIKREYEIDIYACGLCQAGVPCEKGIPKQTAEAASGSRAG
jgi:epoxyqueuosine reductase